MEVIIFIIQILVQCLNKHSRSHNSVLVYSTLYQSHCSFLVNYRMHCANLARPSNAVFFAILVVALVLVLVGVLILLAQLLDRLFSKTNVANEGEFMCVYVLYEKTGLLYCTLKSSFIVVALLYG